MLNLVDYLVEYLEGPRPQSERYHLPLKWLSFDNV